MDCRHMHSCPLITGGIPHNGGPVIGPGCTTVLIEGKPASVAGDVLQCNGAMDTIVTGSASVLINNKPAARIGDKTAHGGTIITGSSNVQIGVNSKQYSTQYSL
ncbi:MAG: type VI secretion protein [Sphingobacteriales bacterium]|nr:MAG: type VI secretion protein [Sphingobacteriales bacterium]